MNANSKLVAVAAVSAIAGATFLGASSVSAHQNGESLVTKIAERFDVSEDEVQAVLDEAKSENQAERETERTEHLDQLVEAGTLTDEQRTQLTEFADEQKAQREELRGQDLTREEMREAMEGLRNEVEAWAETEGIELDDIKGDRERGDRHQRRSEMHDRFDTEFGEPAEDAENES